ncbi:hypothetical protein GO496_16485 [Acidovorax citrulli]|nr:hypothetical protein [Paracidovorax citrulli]MVT38195.1 hypothetical protein [Paracidovorax citrulli]
MPTSSMPLRRPRPWPRLQAHLATSLAALGRDAEADAAYAQAALLGDGDGAGTVANRLRSRMGDPAKNDVASVTEDIFSLSGWLQSFRGQWRERSDASR